MLSNFIIAPESVVNRIVPQLKEFAFSMHKNFGCYADLSHLEDWATQTRTIERTLPLFTKGGLPVGRLIFSEGTNGEDVFVYDSVLVVSQRSSSVPSIHRARSAKKIANIIKRIKGTKEAPTDENVIEKFTPTWHSFKYAARNSTGGGARSSSRMPHVSEEIIFALLAHYKQYETDEVDIPKIDPSEAEDLLDKFIGARKKESMAEAITARIAGKSTIITALDYRQIFGSALCARNSEGMLMPRQSYFVIRNARYEQRPGYVSTDELDLVKSEATISIHKDLNEVPDIAATAAICKAGMENVELSNYRDRDDPFGMTRCDAFFEPLDAGTFYQNSWCRWYFILE